MGQESRCDKCGGPAGADIHLGPVTQLTDEDDDDNDEMMMMMMMCGGPSNQE